MPTHPTHSLTLLLRAVAAGDAAAREALLRLIYDELHALAGREMAREAPGRTLQPTALVHEAYLRLFGPTQGQFNDRRHFFASAARAMRQVLVDDARKRGRLKRSPPGPPAGNGDGPLAAAPVFAADPTDLLALEDALIRLEAANPRAAEVVHLRYFAGLSGDETAEMMGIAPRTVDSEWRMARAWLHRALSGG